MTAVVLRLVPPKERPADRDILEILEGLMERVKSGDTIGIGFVEATTAGGVRTAFVGKKCYHQLSSGASTLAFRLAMGD